MRVLISGAGIAGPALAFWLHRHGLDVTVVESAAVPRAGGQAVDVRGAAREVVTRMGLMARVREERVDERGIAFLDGRGRRLAGMPADAFGGEGFIAEIEIARGDLCGLLLDVTRGDVEYRFGDRVSGLAQDAGGVDVTFASGQRQRFDAVVGADGVHSGVRALAFGPEADYVRHLGAYMAYFSVPDPGDLEHWVQMCNLPGGLVASVRPERPGQAKACLSFRAPVLPEGRADAAVQRRLVEQRFARAGWRVPALLDAMRAAPDFYFDAVSKVDVPVWSRGRVALLGDAGYCGSPLAGLGTSMALVGAYVLAGELAAAPADPAGAFAAYQARLADYVADGISLPPGGVGGFAPSSQLMIRLRGASMGMMTRRPMRDMMAKQFAKAERVALPDYGVGASQEPNSATR